MAAVNPTDKLNLSGEIRYTENLSGDLQEKLINGGGGTGFPLSCPAGGKSHSFGTSAFANYALGKGFMLHGRVSRQSQYFAGQTHDLTQYGGHGFLQLLQAPVRDCLYFSFGIGG